MACMSAIITPLPEFNPDSWDAQVGAEIKRRLVGRGTQEHLAAALGIGQPEVSKRLNGRIGWRGRELAIVADLLDVSLDELCGRGPRHPEDKSSVGKITQVYAKPPVDNLIPFGRVS